MKQTTRSAEELKQLADLAKSVVRRRKFKKFTQEHTAHEAGIALRTLQNLETGRLNPSYLVLRGIATALGTTIGRLSPD